MLSESTTAQCMLKSKFHKIRDNCSCTYSMKLLNLMILSAVEHVPLIGLHWLRRDYTWSTSRDSCMQEKYTIIHKVLDNDEQDDKRYRAMYLLIIFITSLTHTLMTFIRTQGMQSCKGKYLFSKGQYSRGSVVTPQTFKLLNHFKIAELVIQKALWIPCIQGSLIITRIHQTSGQESLATTYFLRLACITFPKNLSNWFILGTNFKILWALNLAKDCFCC